MTIRYLTLFILVSSFFTSISMAADTLTANIDRAWGLSLGDNVTVTVDLTTIENGIDSSSLPAEKARYGTWLYLKTIDVSLEQLAFQYQIVNVPLKNTLIESPTFDIKQANGQWLVIPTTALTIGPSLAVTESAANISMKPDIEPSLISIEKQQQQRCLFIVIAGVAGLILLLWHFGWKTKHRLPFSQAVHDLSRLSWHSVTPDEAARILHTAFNRTADTVVVYGEIDTLIEQQAWLAPLSDEIKLFYQQSEQHFFARKSAQEPDITEVRKLAKACRAKEMLA
ncbi:MAG: hypothetical protein COA90_08025 [Gammaproteobacteria bacterium]|nr:MAG: hypothetical protein COA90_08025 [Gammaproteobacteria bacterium]